MSDAPAFATLAELEATLAAFTRAEIRPEAWNHVRHLAYAADAVFRRAGDFDAALADIRAGILRFNAAVGIENTPTRGYHETVTVFWTREVARLYAARPADEDLLAFVERTVKNLRDGELLFRSYRRETVMAPEARVRYVPPDLEG